MDGLKNEIQALIQEINSVVELFYQQKNQEAYTQLEPLLAKMMNTIDRIFSCKAEHEEMEIDEAGLAEVLKTTLSAMEDQDAILMADVLKYDVIEKFEGICESL